MVGRTMHIGAAGRAADYKGQRLTAYCWVVAVVAASGGLLFGFDVGITGGVESMDPFLIKFFPSIYDKKQADTSNDPYCTFDDQLLQLFTSSMWIAGMCIAPFAGHITRAFGRTRTMAFGGASFLLGAILDASAQNLAMLVCGRVFLGFGVGCAYQSVPLYLSEMSPAQHRGKMNIMFQLFTTVGILVAQLINYAVRRWEYGWRLSLGLAGVPAVMLLLGGLLLPESPNSLVERGRREQGHAVLVRVRGTADVDAEFDDICEAAAAAAAVSNRQAWANLAKREYRPQTVLCSLIPFFQQLTGINAIMFYVPILFQALGSGQDAALLNTVVVGSVNVMTTFVSIALVDRAGRRPLLLEGSLQMIVTQSVVAVLMATQMGADSTMAKGWAVAVLVVICIYVAGFAWSWGPLGILVPSEIAPLETRSATYVVTVTVNLLCTTIVGQFFLSMLCGMRWGIFLFFAGWATLAMLFVAFFLPETKGVPIEEMYTVFARHWFWKGVLGSAGEAVLELEAARSESRNFAKAVAAVEEGTPAGAKLEIKPVGSASSEADFFEGSSSEPDSSEAVLEAIPAAPVAYKVDSHREAQAHSQTHFIMESAAPVDTHPAHVQLNSPQPLKNSPHPNASSSNPAFAAFPPTPSELSMGGTGRPALLASPFGNLKEFGGQIQSFFRHSMPRQHRPRG